MYTQHDPRKDRVWVMYCGKRVSLRTLVESVAIASFLGRRT